MKVAIIGATGYSGIELIRLLQNHPYVEIEMIISGSHDGSRISEVYPHLEEIIDDKLVALDIEQLEKVDLVFFATPSGVSKNTLPLLMDRGIKCIDLSGDFRLKSPGAYEDWYGLEAAEQKYLDQAIYGLSEIYSKKISTATYIANPGCYPTAVLLGLIPALKSGIIDPGSIVIDGKSGVSGAGRKASLGTHYAEINENVKAYKLGRHQHIPEIEQTLGDVYGEKVNITFSTHLIPMSRGIMCTMYADFQQDVTTDEIIHLYKEYYQNSPFVRVRKSGIWPATKEVAGSNYCDLGFLADHRTGKLSIVSVIDNVVKGAAGQAIQNMNLMNGWKATTGLLMTPVYP
ncbi:N-acetyl-gamma-glutamyl-phosphate reductase [Bacillus pakistanensis]|uniref:N-acetyl-gamma-glutamyl-phosphate reductase n=1 Tax=Rossellomorea pakistanensis TaxID=992288 RepID=A0ABS2N826_9BACI|nr:N-acetyl-gamma-glutamyl-phosphate reductase [Bacillus pakistanensis]MBM7584013.1 N-acetyl-gamma-glutamyl-phosphate reductase [Bacillus pakistanensis]